MGKYQKKVPRTSCVFLFRVYFSKKLPKTIEENGIPNINVFVE